MAEGRGRLEWEQTSWLLAVIHNGNRGKDSPVMQPKDFNPYERSERPTPERISLDKMLPAIRKGIRYAQPV